MKPFRAASLPLGAFACLEVTYLDEARRPTNRGRTVFVLRRLISGSGRVLHEHIHRVLGRPPERTIRPGCGDMRPFGHGPRSGRKRNIPHERARPLPDPSHSKCLAPPLSGLAGRLKQSLRHGHVPYRV